MNIIYHSIARSPYVVENLGFCITDKPISFGRVNSLAGEFKLIFLIAVLLVFMNTVKLLT